MPASIITGNIGLPSPIDAEAMTGFDLFLDTSTGLSATSAQLAFETGSKLNGRVLAQTVVALQSSEYTDQPRS
jgi:hypothetical protein